MLITSCTPLRVSFFGGGTDYPEYFERHPGAVLGMAINKYIYISLVTLKGVQPYNFRVSYSKLEHVQHIHEIQHPVIREVLNAYGDPGQPLDINVMSDVPANSGLGSSSAFTVGFLNLINTLRQEGTTRFELACRAINIERNVLKENVGVQDQLHAAFGGINRFDFNGSRINISPLRVSGENLSAINKSSCLIFTGQKRKASDILELQMERTKKKTIDTPLSHLVKLTEQAVDVLETRPPAQMLQELGGMLHEGWLTKKALSPTISNSAIDDLYESALAAGAIGGKLCGAGAGGFLYVLVPDDRIEEVRKAVHPFQFMRIEMDTGGTRVLRGT